MFESLQPGLSLYNLVRPEVLSNPYPLYHRLRSEDPVHWDANLGAWVLTRYADVVSALRDPRLSVQRAMSPGAGLDPLSRALSKQMLFADSPDHTRLRGLVNKSFTSRMVEALRPHIQQLVDGLLDRVVEAGRMDVIQDLAYPLPLTVIAEMLGVPAADRQQLKQWSDDFAALIGTIDLAEPPMTQALHSVEEIVCYLSRVIDHHRESPRDDLLSALIATEEEGDALSTDELVMNSLLLLVAGHETATNLIGNGLLALLQHPDERQKLEEAPSLIVGAVEELLRYDSPVQLTERFPRQELEIGGKSISPGQPVEIVLAAANRDPAQFPEPDRLDLSRRENRHVSFGHGIHFCVGAPLARLEGQIALSTLLYRLPGLRLETEALQWRSNQVVRGLASLPVRF